MDTTKHKHAAHNVGSQLVTFLRSVADDVASDLDERAGSINANLRSEADRLDKAFANREASIVADMAQKVKTIRTEVAGVLRDIETSRVQQMEATRSSYQGYVNTALAKLRGEISEEIAKTNAANYEGLRDEIRRMGGRRETD